MTTDHIQTMLASFLRADASADSVRGITRYSEKDSRQHCVVDAGAVLEFREVKPSVAYISELGGDRLYAMDSGLLLQSPQDLIGSYAEIALAADDYIKWAAFKKITRTPKKVWLSSRGADLYEYHSRFIRHDGSSDYRKRVAAIDKNGRPVVALIEGTRDVGGTPDGTWLTLAASLIEDTHRAGVFVATVRDTVGVVFPVPQGEHLELFRLRDGPMTASRKKPLLHWVAKHLRKRGTIATEVKEHLRGIHEFVIDGMSVKLDAEVTK